MSILHIDFETRSACELKDQGLDNYAKHPSTDVHCMAYAFDDGPSDVWAWDPMNMSKDVHAHVANGGLVYAHNASFELAIWNHIMVPRYGWPVLRPEQVRCTMVMCYAMGLPGALENAAPALGITERKDATGKRTMMLLAKPKADGTFWTPDTAPEKFAHLYDYCKQDVEVERALHHRLMELSPSEQNLWTLDQTINNRGVRVDLPSIEKAIKLVDAEKARLNARMLHVTQGVVGSCTEVQLLVKWVKLQGVKLTGLAKAAVLDALSGDLPANVREALELRKEAAKSSTAKLVAMKERASSDGRVRGIHQFHGANTGRWAGRGIQLQNYIKKRYTTRPEDVEDIFAHLHDRDYIDAVYGPTMDAIADCLRGMIVPTPDHDFVAADFSAVEAGVLAWLAGEESVLEIFRGHGKIYEHAAAGIYHVPSEQVTKSQRQIGKVAVLACFASETLVLTDSGCKAMVEVSSEDRLWDGEKWVTHTGVISRKMRKCMVLDGVRVTPGHLIDTKGTWRQAKLLGSSASMLRQALETGSENLPCCALNAAGSARVTQTLLLSNVPVAPNRTWSTNTTSEKVPALGATLAPKSRLGIGANSIGATQISFRTHTTANGCSTECLHAYSDAKTPTPNCMFTTDSEEYVCSARGSRIEKRSYATSYRLTDGTYRNSNSTGSTSTKATSQATCASLRRLRTHVTSVKSRILRLRLQDFVHVYDITNAGDLNRFTIKSGSGWLLVHNCGYGGGIGAFQSMAKNYGIKVPDAEADEIKSAWREAHPNIVSYWYEVERAAIEALTSKGTVYAGPVGRQVAFRKSGSFLWCRLPSGRCLCYPYPEIRTVTTPWGAEKDALTYMTVVADTRGKILPDPNSSGKWCRISTYGGSLAENLTQAVARDLLAEAMVRLESAGFPIVFHVHDEVITEVPKDSPADTLARVERIMSEVPAWATGLPLAAEGWRGPRFRK